MGMPGTFQVFLFFSVLSCKSHLMFAMYYQNPYLKVRNIGTIAGGENGLLYGIVKIV